MSKVSHREAHRVFWMVKGHFKTSEQCIFDSYQGYFYRLWHNEEAYIREEGFEEAYEKLILIKGEYNEY